MLRRVVRLTCKVYGFCVYRYESNLVGFIGMGTTGGKLVQKLLVKGTKVIGYDIDKGVEEPLRQQGCVIAAHPFEVASKTDIVFTLLPNYHAVVDACDGEKGLANGAKKGMLLVDLSTTGPVNTIRLYDALAHRNIDFLSAPISGSTHVITDEAIVFFVSGEEKFLAKAEPYLKKMGHATSKTTQTVCYIGKDIADGQVARCCSALLLAITMVGTAEVMNIGIRFGLNPKILNDAMSSTSARCWACQHYNPVPQVSPSSPSNTEYSGGSAVDTFTTVLALAQDAAARIHSPIPLGSLACQMLNLAVARGYSHKDISVVYKLLKQTLIKE